MFHATLFVNWLDRSLTIWLNVMVLMLWGSMIWRSWSISSWGWSWLMTSILITSSLNWSSVRMPSLLSSIYLNNVVKCCKNFSCSWSWKSRMTFKNSCWYRSLADRFCWSFLSANSSSRVSLLLIIFLLLSAFIF